MIDLGYSQPDECGKRQKIGGGDVLSPREYDPERLMRFAFRSSLKLEARMTSCREVLRAEPGLQELLPGG